MLTVINFAEGEPFERNRWYCSFTAKYVGKADNVIEYRMSDIPLSYKQQHKDIFGYNRGCGLWLWKPYIVYKTLQEIKVGSWVFYVDSGTVFVNNIHKLIRCAEENGSDILLFEIPLLNRQFTKRESFVLQGISDYSQNQVASGYLLVKKTPKTCSFIKEWLECCEDERMLSPKRMCVDVSEFSDFVSHREDQSVLTLLCTKYNMPVFRDCSDYGEYPHMYYSTHYDYKAKDYPNSTYPTIVLSNRKKHPLVYLLRYWMKKILFKFGVISSRNVIEKKKRKNI